MALIRWEPFREVESLQREMNSLFDTLMPRTAQGSIPAGAGFLPAAEMHETPNAIELKVEVPGMEANDLDVQVTAEAVSISGERKIEKKSEERGMTRSEFRYGRFQRIIPLPTRIQNDNVQAEYTNGVLRLTLPKAEAEKNKVVTINLGAQSNQGDGQQSSQQKGNGQPASQQESLTQQSSQQKGEAQPA